MYAKIIPGKVKHVFSYDGQDVCASNIDSAVAELVEYSSMREEEVRAIVEAVIEKYDRDEQDTAFYSRTVSEESSRFILNNGEEATHHEGAAWTNVYHRAISLANKVSSIIPGANLWAKKGTITYTFHDSGSSPNYYEIHVSNTDKEKAVESLSNRLVDAYRLHPFLASRLAASVEWYEQTQIMYYLEVDGKVEELDGKIPAIKRLRELTNQSIGLKEAKGLTDEAEVLAAY